VQAKSGETNGIAVHIGLGIVAALALLAVIVLSICMICFMRNISAGKV
jgi:hypothetical protein